MWRLHNRVFICRIQQCPTRFGAFAFVLRIQKLEEQEDYIIMMKERKNSKWLHIDSHIITPFLTWQGT